MPDKQDQKETKQALESFEANLAELEQVVKQLEAGDLTLEQALILFEKGVALAQTCRKQLEEAETRIEILLKKNNRVEAQPYEAENE
jgi:exodeoxyribonuclease VII small subunit